MVRLFARHLEWRPSLSRFVEGIDTPFTEGVGLSGHEEPLMSKYDIVNGSVTFGVK